MLDKQGFLEQRIREERLALRHIIRRREGIILGIYAIGLIFILIVIGATIWNSL